MPEFPLGFLLARSSSGTRPLDAASIAALKGSARVEHWSECGWACASGFDAKGDIVAAVHANSRAEIEVATGTAKPDFDDWGCRLYRDDGNAG